MGRPPKIKDKVETVGKHEVDLIYMKKTLRHLLDQLTALQFQIKRELGLSDD